MLNLLKKIWDKCGDADFSAKAVMIIMTLLTVHIVTTDFYPDAVKAVVALVNFIVVITYILEE